MIIIDFLAFIFNEILTFFIDFVFIVYFKIIINNTKTQFVFKSNLKKIYKNIKEVYKILNVLCSRKKKINTINSV